MAVPSSRFKPSPERLTPSAERIRYEAHWATDDPISVFIKKLPLETFSPDDRWKALTALRVLEAARFDLEEAVREAAVRAAGEPSA